MSSDFHELVRGFIVYANISKFLDELLQILA
jgi:hypothetical protein